MVTIIALINIFPLMAKKNIVGKGKTWKLQSSGDVVLQWMEKM